jgi:type I restriction enzyme S subunit
MTMEIAEPSAKYLARTAHQPSEVGPIPADWSVVCLHAIAKVTSGKRLPMGHFVGDRVTAHPYIRVTDMRIGTVALDDIKYVPDEAYPPITNYRIFKADLFISVAGTLGVVGKIPDALDGANLTENADRISEIRCDRDYLMYILLSPVIQDVIESEQTVGAQPKLALARIRKFSIPLPPTATEQRAIATALSDVDALIAGLERLIAKKRDIKQAAMQQLLTGQTRLPGFSGEWASVQLGELLDVRHGKNQHAVEAPDGPYPILATGGQIGTASQPLHDRPSVLIGRKGTINKPQYMDTPFWTVDTLFYCDVQPPNSAKFLYYRFLLIDWMQYNEASGVPSLNGRTIERIEIGCPDAKEQTAIATALSDMDTDLTALESRLAKTRAIKQGMMQELLTGRTRLV